MFINDDYLGNYGKSIAFLNTKAVDYYTGEITFLDDNVNFRIRKLMVTALNFIERTFVGTFNRDLGSIIEDVRLFKEMYPYACKKEILNIDSIRKLFKVNEKLEAFRNINAHAKVSKSDLEFLRCDFNVNNIVKLDENIKYQRCGQITIAGLLMYLFLFLRQEHLKALTAIDRSILILIGKYKDLNSKEDFCEKYTKVTLTNNIRKVEGDDLVTSIFGEYMDLVEFDDDEFKISFGSNNHPTFIAKGKISGNKVTIYKDSLTKTYYIDDYELEIKDLDGFIEFSNQLPALALLDYLYEQKISQFDRKTHKFISSNWDLISKINHPKFYGDKNLHILCLPKTFSDFRIMSNAISKTLFLCLLNLENDLYMMYNEDFNNNDYSKLNDLLKNINISDELRTQIVILRNFAVHGYILDEYIQIDDKIYQFTLKSILDNLSDLLDALKEFDEGLYNKFYNFMIIKLVNGPLKFKYKLVNEATINLLKNNVNKLDEEFKNRLAYVNNSGIDDESFAKIVRDLDPVKGIIDLKIPKMKDVLHLFRNSKSFELIENYCKNNDLMANEIIENSIHTKISLKKL